MPAAALEAAPDAAAPPSVMPWSADHPCAAPDLAHARPASSSRHARTSSCHVVFFPSSAQVLEKQKKGAYGIFLSVKP